MKKSAEPLAARYDVALLDLDGVVYIGSKAVTGAPDALRTARQLGMRLSFVTNNAARPPAVVADHLTSLGIAARPEEVVTSAQAAAHYLAERLAPGSAVLVVGTTGLIEALRERGLRPVHSADDGPAAVVQGYSPHTDWPMLAEAAVAIRRGAPWVATNLDPTVPSARGPLPGNGSLVAAVRHATGAHPTATGKPDPTMHRETVERSGARRPLVVGDRLDTDIEGARAVGCDSLLVLTGVTTPADLLTAPARHRPDYLGADLGALLTGHPEVEIGQGEVRCGSWRVEAVAGDAAEPRLELSSSAGDLAPLDALRACCVAAWRDADQRADPAAGHRAAGHPADRDGGTEPGATGGSRHPRPARIAAGDAQSRRVLISFGLAPEPAHAEPARTESAHAGPARTESAQGG